MLLQKSAQPFKKYLELRTPKIELLKMKNNFLFLALLFVAANLPAQTTIRIQNGLVREYNSGKKPVAYVQIIFSDAGSTASGPSGKFRLAFSGKKPGDLIFYKEISKKGFELVNERELQILKIGNTDNLGKDIILAKVGVLDAAKKEYYNISDKALLASFNKEIKALQGKLKNYQLTEKAYLDKYNTLSRQYEQQKNALDALADLFARIDFDDVSAEYKKSFEFFEAGRIDEALKILEGADLLGRTKKRLEEKERIEKAETTLTQQKAENEIAIQDDLRGLQLQAQLYVLTLQIEKAERLYDQVLRLDSTDIKVLNSVADFYRENHRYEKAIRVLFRIISHPQAEDWEKANGQSHIGEMYIAIGQLKPAMQAFQLCQEAYAKMLETKADLAFFKSGLAISYEKIGSTHIKLGHLDTAMVFYRKCTQLSLELYEANPENRNFKSSLAISYEKIGSTYIKLENLDSTLIYYEKYTKLSKELCEDFEQNEKFKNGLAAAYGKIGEAFTALGNFNKALEFFQNGNQLLLTLHSTFPQNRSFKNGLAISYLKLGETNANLRNWVQALTFYEKFNQLEQELWDANLENVDFKNGLALSCEKLGEANSALRNLARALPYFKKFNQLEQELWEANPQDVEVKLNLALSYEKLGETHTGLGSLDTALTSFEYATRLLEQLYGSYPLNVSFRNRLAVSYLKLGETKYSMRNLDTALTFYQKCNQIEKELCEAYPQNISFKNGLAVSYEKLGTTYAALGNLDTALIFFEERCRIGKEISEAYPQNSDYSNGLAISYYKLGRSLIYRGENQDKDKARFYFIQCQVIWQELTNAYPNIAEFQDNLNLVKNALEHLDK